MRKISAINTLSKLRYVWFDYETYSSYSLRLHRIDCKMIDDYMNGRYWSSTKTRLSLLSSASFKMTATSERSAYSNQSGLFNSQDTSNVCSWILAHCRPLWLFVRMLAYVNPVWLTHSSLLCSSFSRFHHIKNSLCMHHASTSRFQSYASNHFKFSTFQYLLSVSWSVSVD